MLTFANEEHFGSEQLKEVEEEGKEWVDDGSLPLDKDGNLPFYFLDAHEDARLAQTVYLFGKVHSQTSYCQ